MNNAPVPGKHDQDSGSSSEGDRGRSSAAIIAFWLLILLGGAWLASRSLEQRFGPDGDLYANWPDTPSQSPHREGPGYPAARRRVSSLSESGKTRQGLKLFADSHGHFRLTVDINGEPVRVMVDTGASSVAIPLHVARALALPLGNTVLISTANGRSLSHESLIADLRLGPLHLQNVEAIISPGLGGDALLGMSALRHWELRQRGDTLMILE